MRGVKLNLHALWMSTLVKWLASRFCRHTPHCSLASKVAGVHSHFRLHERTNLFLLWKPKSDRASRCKLLVGLIPIISASVDFFSSYIRLDESSIETAGHISSASLGSLVGIVFSAGNRPHTQCNKKNLLLRLLRILTLFYLL
jgi:hypothetical protein